MPMPPFQGSITALITPFNDGKVDAEAFRKLVEWQIDQGTHGLVPCGTTGESPTLSHDEHREVVELCIEAASGRVPVIAGTGSNSTAEAVELTLHAKSAGADGVLVVTPYYNKPTQEGLYLHYKAINDCTDIPILIYNIPGRSVVDMTVDTMARLFKLKNIVGVKDATANMARVSQQRAALGKDFVQLSGEDATALGFMAHGGQGCISVTANVAPALCSEFQLACLGGNFKRALELQDRLMPLHDALFVESNPGPVKYAASKLGLCNGETRLPLAPLAPASKTESRRGDRRGRPRPCLDHIGDVMAPKRESGKLVAENRKARFNYEIEDKLEAGIALTGSEVKSLRAGKANIADSYASSEGGELYLINAHIAEYVQAGRNGHAPTRPRKLLLHRKEIGKLAGAIQREGMTVVPLKMYFNARGIAKVELGLAKGKKLHDKRETEKKRDWERQKGRLMREKG